MERISSTLRAAIWEHVRAKCKTQKYLKFKSAAKCQKNVTALLHIRTISSLSPFYLLLHHCAVCTPKSQERKAQHCTYCFQARGTSMRGSCPWTGCLRITLCAWTQALCQYKQSLGTHETFGRRTRGAPCRADTGMWGQSSSGAGFPLPGKDLAFLPPPWGCSLNKL